MKRNTCLPVICALSAVMLSSGSSVPAAEAKNIDLSREPKWLIDSGLASKSARPSEPGAPVNHDAWGFNAEIGGSAAGFQTFDSVSPDIAPAGSPERANAAENLASLQKVIKSVHARGLKLFGGTDIFVFPKTLVIREKMAICDEKGRIDILRPRTQELFRLMLRETFEKAPDLDGLVIRTGEVYLHQYPFHVASGNFSDTKRQGGTAIIHGAASHIEILRILREEVCERLGKKLIYRTWSFGPQSFHEDPALYLKVTDAIPPHPNLIFSIKHTKGDFHQLTIFNPTILIGKHRQIIEVQSQREAYGKGSHPFYVGQGVIEGFEEHAWLMKPGQPKGLRDVVDSPLYAGTWTWSRGGGWEGPFITNGLWCELNTYVVASFAKNPKRTEAEIFHEFATQKLKLSESDAELFHRLNLLSTRAVLRGQMTTLGAHINEWWARDHFFEEPDLADFVRKGLVEKALAEKAEAIAMWREIETLADRIHFADQATSDFVRVSCAYGRIKYSIVEQAWTILFLGKAGDASGTYDREKLRAAIARYDALWTEFRELAAKNPACASLHKDIGFEGRPGLGAGINRYRKILGLPVIHSDP